MRMIKLCLVLVLMMPNLSHASERAIPKMRSGGEKAQLTPKEMFRQVAQQMNQLGPEAHALLHARAYQEEIQRLKEILPQWAGEIPLTVVLHINFKDSDDPLERAKKFLALGLFVRDMYQNLDIMRELGTFYTPVNERLSIEKRRYLFARCLEISSQLIPLFRLPPGYTKAQAVDYWLSLAQIEYWTSIQMRLTEGLMGEATEIALRALDDAEEAERLMMGEPMPELRSRVIAIRNNVKEFLASRLSDGLLAALVRLAFTRHPH